MRQAPYPAAEDETMRELFVARFLEGRTVICTGSVSENGTEWSASVIEGRDGMLHFVECVTAPGRPRKTVVVEADQAHWTAAFERLMAANDQGVPFDVNSWLAAGGLVVARGGWDKEAESAMWHRVVDVGSLIQFSGSPEAEIVKMTVRIAAAKGDLVQVVQELKAMREQRIADSVEHLKRTGTRAVDDDGLAETFGAGSFAGATLVWSLADRHGERPYRACVLMGEKGVLHLAETFGAGAGKLGLLEAEDWRRLVGLARLRMLETCETDYGEAYDAADWITALMPRGSAPDAATLRAIEEAAEMKAAGLSPN
jgi:hypothetical protein